MNGMIKKILIMIVACALVFQSLCVSAFADSIPKIVVSEETAAVGDTVELDVSLENNPGISCVTLSINYNTSALKLEGVSVDSAFGGQSHFSKKLVWISGSDCAKDGTFATLTFKVLDGAKGNVPVSVSYVAGDICNYNEDDVNFSIEAGGVNVTATSSPTIRLSSCEAGVGETVDVAMSLENNPGISCMTLSIVYDKDSLSLEQVNVNPDLGGQTQFTKKLVWITNRDSTFCGVFATFSFKVLDGAAGELPISVGYTNGDICNYNEDDVNFDVVGGAIDVVSSKINAASIVVGQALTLTINASVPSTVISPKMRFTMDDDIRTDDGVKSSDGTWNFSSNIIYANNMSDVVYLELLDGDDVIKTLEYSVREYCDGLYGMSASELGLTAAKYASLRTFVADMLEYGAMAQVYTHHNTDDLANNLAWVATEKTTTFVKPNSDKATVVSAKNENNKIAAANVLLNEAVEIMFHVKADTADTLRVKCGEETVDYSISDYTLQGGYYEISVGKISASGLDDVYNVSLMASGDIVHQVTYSVNSYVASKCKDTDTNLANLVKAIYNYGLSAKLYVIV